MDRSAILRTAHAAARVRMAPRRVCGFGYRLDRTANAFVSTCTYAEAFRVALRAAWAGAKADAARATWPAPPPLPAAIAARVADLDAWAAMCPITFRGNERGAALYAEARALRATAHAA